MSNKNAESPAYGFVDNRSSSYEDNEVHYGFSKKEEALLRFMCAIVSTLEEDTNVDEKLSDAIEKEARLSRTRHSFSYRMCRVRERRRVDL